MFISCSALVLAQVGVFGTVGALVAVNAYVAFYEMGVGPIPWLIIAEMFEAKYVTVIMSYISQWSWFVNFFVGLVFPTLHKVLGVYTFVPFVVILALSFLFTWIALPETHGKTPAQVVAGVQPRKRFRTTPGKDTDEEAGGQFSYWNCTDGDLT
jgi:SP family facilitated glucose transporter-like MFS transporter 3